MIAAAQRSAGGQNVFYIGDTKPKGREFIGYAAHFAKVVAKEMLTVEDGIFFDQKADGTTQAISSLRDPLQVGISGSSAVIPAGEHPRPSGHRGHRRGGVSPGCPRCARCRQPLLTWGGRIRVISSHNGISSPINELSRTRAGKNPFSVHTYSFGDAVKNGLYKRVLPDQAEE